MARLAACNHQFTVAAKAAAVRLVLEACQLRLQLASCCIVNQHLQDAIMLSTRIIGQRLLLLGLTVLAASRPVASLSTASEENNRGSHRIKQRRTGHLPLWS